jgi:hypothetical protein
MREGLDPAQSAAARAGVRTPLGLGATELYERFVAEPGGTSSSRRWVTSVWMA